MESLIKPKKLLNQLYLWKQNYKEVRIQLMSGQNQHEHLLNTINEIQKTLDEIFIFMDDKEDVSQLNLDSVLFNLNSTKIFVNSAKNNLLE